MLFRSGCGDDELPRAGRAVRACVVRLQFGYVGCWVRGRTGCYVVFWAHLRFWRRGQRSHAHPEHIQEVGYADVRIVAGKCTSNFPYAPPQSILISASACHKSNAPSPHRRTQRAAQTGVRSNGLSTHRNRGANCSRTPRSLHETSSPNSSCTRGVTG